MEWWRCGWTWCQRSPILGVHDGALGQGVGGGGGARRGAGRAGGRGERGPTAGRGGEGGGEPVPGEGGLRGNLEVLPERVPGVGVPEAADRQSARGEGGPHHEPQREDLRRAEHLLEQRRGSDLCELSRGQPEVNEEAGGLHEEEGVEVERSCGPWGIV